VSQSKRWSLVESVTNLVIGFAINWWANLVILPWFGFSVTGRQAFLMGFPYMAISLARQYALRRAYNWWGR
jgi:hypothetical protein